MQYIYYKVNLFSRLLDVIIIGCSLYCKFGNFQENLVFVNSVKRHNCNIKYSQLWHDLPILVNDRVISSLHEGFSRK